ncbi:hypothetical protein BDP27DRAFT_1294333 [Rhodocollybia butyracea]|uniref:Uncharacterized protein n=1 Tax=Rhodocollybia butyracea TaxID=206335 RepID=A0A9P5PTJ7_9AGAR|nr:hypothetical protein BDP27DRAFT_1294333 [Rhodocollybia butyracea]
MSEASRPALSSAYSFSGSSSSPSVAIERPLKRTLTSTSDMDFFKPAESSFNPRPYTPSANPPSNSHSRKYPHLGRHPNRSENSLLATVGMDPLPTEPSVVFIHPPFADFPGAHNCTEGLTYKVMAENPEWFLDASDYIRVEENPNAPTIPTPASSSLIPYPPHLEPPRGWCPAKKKEIKVHGHEGWPDGEEPRLRCTFCRRTYAGVNAKSMWRRHVFEKHRIAMSNRRDGGERPRGRGSSKENKPTTKLLSSEEGHDRLVNIDVAPQPFAQSTSQTQHKIRFRPAITGDPSVPSDATFDNSTETNVPFTPPLTPLKRSPDLDGRSSGTLQTSTPPISSVPPSPYDPQATPAFRHSPAPTPYDQPWRYPSPSHPFSKARDLSLSVLLRNSGTLTIDSPGPVPNLMHDESSSPGSSLISKKSFFVELDTPGSITNKRLVGLKSSSSQPVEESPLSRSLIGRSHHQRNFSELSLDDLLSLPTARNPFLTSLEDWESDNNSSPVTRGLVHPRMTPAESPVVRKDISLNQSGLGIGLLEPFVLPKNYTRAQGSSSDVEDEFEVMDNLTNSRSNSDSGQSESITPPPKKRKITI